MSDCFAEFAAAVGMACCHYSARVDAEVILISFCLTCWDWFARCRDSRVHSRDCLRSLGYDVDRDLIRVAVAPPSIDTWVPRLGIFLTCDRIGNGLMRRREF